jgi:hypothetical protein
MLHRLQARLPDLQLEHASFALSPDQHSFYETFARRCCSIAAWGSFFPNDQCIGSISNFRNASKKVE